MNVAQWLYQTALARPSAPAVRVGEDLFCDDAALARRAEALSRPLAAQGVGQGDRAALIAAEGGEAVAHTADATISAEVGEVRGGPRSLRQAVLRG